MGASACGGLEQQHGRLRRAGAAAHAPAAGSPGMGACSGLEQRHTGACGELTDGTSASGELGRRMSACGGLEQRDTGACGGLTGHTITNAIRRG
ncbi:hypothetical protein ACFVT5_29285 [Streptomyces sp. NPDC058001]|uniref:hypothetical protein n=1 Tax=Streptomyces sp. NPDC058001 TaxID=3346300 RepID=UPI0036E1BED5